MAACDCHFEGLLLLYFDASGHIELLSLVPLVSAGSKVYVRVCVSAQAWQEVRWMKQEERRKKWATEEGMKDEGGCKP